jgi:rhodanese-related sulfurtransferase
MAAPPRRQIGLVDPAQAWEEMGASGALLVDVRTRAEWTFVGLPELAEPGRMALIEWTGFPDMTPNPAFLDAVERAAEETEARRVFFLCRSGHRSHDAATAAQARFDSRGRDAQCFNVLEGFEGDLDDEGRRGRLNGWKARGLPWRQG